MIESIKMAFSSIWINKMRSLLTMLGIIIGIASVIAVVAIGEGGEAVIGSEFESVGMNRVVIANKYSEDFKERDYMNHDDVEAIERAFSEEIVAAAPSMNVSGKVSSITKKEGIDVVLNGASEDFLSIQKLDIIKGRFLIEADIIAKRNVAIVEEDFAIEKYGTTDVLGKQAIVKSNSQSIPVVIVGVFKPEKSMMASMIQFEQPKNFYMPITTVEKIAGVGDRVYSIDMNLSENTDIQGTIDKMIELVERRHRNLGEDKYQGFSAEGQLEMIQSVTGVFTMVISAIAAISLLVGGIGVMNIMLVSVTERTREIGIRKALGAKYGDIMKQFLVESVIISFIGGVIGTILGIGVSFIVSKFIKVPPSTSLSTILIAWGFATAVGVFFGLYPASKAAKLNPIDALRYE